MELREVLLRTFLKPVWLPGPPKVERWTCPACAREVDRVSPAWKGIWFTAEPAEVLALCSRTHGTHDRKGSPLPEDDVELGDDALPIVAVDVRGARTDRPASFVALVPPHGIAFVLEADGLAYELRRLQRPPAPSDLVGSRAASLPADVIGRVAVDDVRFEEGLGAVRVVAELGLAVGDAPAGDALERRERAAAV